MATSPPPMAQLLAEAAARRHTSTESNASVAQLMQEHEKRQMYRRLIDPGIFRPNSKQIAMDSLNTLSTIAENILREPENPKYHTFKHENDTIRRRLIQPKGALEYALALGFRPKVDSFQSLYVFNPSKIEDLRIGAAMLREAIDRETQKEERSRQSKEAQKAAVAVVAQNVKLAFLDDRKGKAARDEMEREQREARELARSSPSTSAAPALSPLSDESSPPMPGLGYTLATVDSGPSPDQPPPYDN